MRGLGDQPRAWKDQAWAEFDVVVCDWLLGLGPASDVVKAAAALVMFVGGDSSALWQVAAWPKEANPSDMLLPIFNAYRDREHELPTRDEAVHCAFQTRISAMLAGSIAPEDAAFTLWRLSELQPEGLDSDFLAEFRGLAINLDLARTPECDFDLDPAQWRAEMLSLARAALDGIELDDWYELHHKGEHYGA